MGLSVPLAAPLLASTLLAIGPVGRGDAFSVSFPSGAWHSQQHRPTPTHSLRPCSSGGTALPVAMIAPPQRPLPIVGRTTSRSRSGCSSRTSLQASGGGRDAGPGTQQLSREAKLAISVLIDLIGLSSFAVPAFGEATDLGWAPISSALIYYLYGNSIFAGLAFVEEILPGFDVIPTATIAWFLTNSEVGKNVTKAAAGKKPSSTVPPPPPPPPGARGDPGAEKVAGRGSRTVNDDLVQSGVIDVDPQD